MITRYMENNDLGVTKDTYFEMCEMLGEEPSEENMPVEFQDFPDLVQQCFLIHRTLTDVWDTMNGNYMGKDYTIVFKLFELYQIEQTETLVALDLLHSIDAVKSKTVAEKIRQKTSQTK